MNFRWSLPCNNIQVIILTGELEKRRKKELKKTKLNSFKKSKKAKKWAGEKSPREEGKDDDDQKKKQYKPIPNYFVSIQISNPEVGAIFTIRV